MPGGVRVKVMRIPAGAARSGPPSSGWSLVEFSAPEDRSATISRAETVGTGGVAVSFSLSQVPAGKRARAVVHTTYGVVALFYRVDGTDYSADVYLGTLAVRIGGTA